MIGKLLGLGTTARHVGEAVGGVAEIFVGNRAERDAADLERYNRALAQFGEEFTRPASGWFDGLVNGMNRLPRPMMAIGTLGLFAYAMVDPHGFATRMQGLGYVPEPLWWLLGAVVSFYFGARELHHYRGRKLELPPPPPPSPSSPPSSPPPRGEPPLPPPANRSTPATGHAAPAGADLPVPFPAPAAPPPRTAAAPAPAARGPAAPASARDSATDPDHNAAFEEWRARRA